MKLAARLPGQLGVKVVSNPLEGLMVAQDERLRRG